MKTVCIQIGNTDDRLSQAEWADFVEHLRKAIRAFSCGVHFSGGSSNESPWQNYCWVFELEDDPLVTESFQRQLARLRAGYKQDSVAWLEGKTLFI